MLQNLALGISLVALLVLDFNIIRFAKYDRTPTSLERLNAPFVCINANEVVSRISRFVCGSVLDGQEVFTNIVDRLGLVNVGQ
jgi:hypothetical protein